MKFAFLIMREDFNDKADRAEIHGGEAQIVGVPDIESAVKNAKRLQEEGVGCIELCGAFSAEDAEKIVSAAENKIPIGYTTHLKKQNEVFAEAFS